MVCQKTDVMEGKGVFVLVEYVGSKQSRNL